MMIKYRNFRYHFVRGMFEKFACLLARWHAKLKHNSNNNNNNNNNNNIYFLTSKIHNSVVNHKKMPIKFDEKEYWCELLNVSNISYKP